MNCSHMEEVLQRLSSEYGDTSECFLNYEKPYELLIAGILSAQCKDTTTNMVTRELFSKYRYTSAYRSASVEEIMDIIRPCGCYQRKAGFIIGCTDQLIKRFQSVVPHDINQLVTLPGVGRKIANLVVMEVFSIHAVVVDTHVLRVSKRLGISEVWMSAEDVEFNLRRNVPVSKWSCLTRQLIKHGRAVCDAKNPKCSSCILKDICKGR